MPAPRRRGGATTDSAGHARGGDSGLIDLDGLLAEMKDAVPVAAEPRANAYSDGIATARVPTLVSAVPDAQACVTKALSQ
jgi:hypothetical protein